MNEVTKSFIEVQFPISKISKESYKERMSNYSQTLTGLGKWWGRKPLVLVRAAIIGLLMPASNDPIKDREIFLKLMTMDEEGLWQRKSKPITQKELYEHLLPREREKWFNPESSADKPRFKRGLTKEQKDELQRLVFMRFSYDKKLEYCSRPEQISGPSEESWQRINEHLGTTAFSLPELIQQLGEKQFGHSPRVGDAFCGGGSIPFEAARIGCEAYGSDLNPVAALLSWAALNIVGGGEEIAEEVSQAQAEVYAAVDHQISEWGIEHNEEGWRADAYLYCTETTCPECGWKVPLAPSWVIGEKSMCVAKLVPVENDKKFDIYIESDVSAREMKEAKEAGTIQSSDLVCPNSHCKKHTPITRLRGDRRGEEGTEYGLRMWQNHDLVPRPGDVYQERLYCIRWVDSYIDENGKEKRIRFFRAPDDQDLIREQKVLRILMECFDEWQENGYIPSRKIEPGGKTDEPIRTRGWTHWHHLFNPRQLLVNGTFLQNGMEIAVTPHDVALILLSIGRCCDYNARLSRWHSHGANEKSEQVFSNQALNTLYNYGVRTTYSLDSAFFGNRSIGQIPDTYTIGVADVRNINCCMDYWITDPPYADAINYHELTEFFLAWYEKHLSMVQPWYTDTKRVLAVTGSDDVFKKNMVVAYRTLRENMPDDGMQIVMFTHQDPSVWADLTLILWAAGLSVTSAWCIATETDSAMRTGNYVQGTVLLVLRKQTSELTAFLDEISHEVENEVKSQLDSMLALDDKEDPNFGDTDYQLAAYAAALRVLTKYRHIEEIDVDRELTRVRQAGEVSPVEQLIAQAVEIACNYLMPSGIEKNTWQAINPEERFYIKGLEMESHGEYRAGAYQELARGFGLRDYKYLLANARANENRLKNASEFAARNLGDEGFENSILRHTLFAVREVVRTEETEVGRNWLRNELGDRYWNQRQLVIALLDYLVKFEFNQNMEHWHKDAHAAHLLMGAIRNEDHI